MHEVCIRIHIMWYIHISKCQNNFLQKSVESPPHYFPCVVFTIYDFMYICGGVAQVDNCIHLRKGGKMISSSSM